MPKVIIIIQARMGATRLYGKPLKEILGKPILYYVVNRCKQAALAHDVVVATTTHKRDDQIVNWCKKEHVPYARGSEEDVLSRYLLAAKKYQADVIVRVTADNPLIEPQIIDSIISSYLNYHWDYGSNTLKRTYPRGLDVEVFSFKALQTAAECAKEPSEKEHVTPYFYRHPEKFRLGNVAHTKDYSAYRFTVDTEEDFQLIQQMIEALSSSWPNFTLNDLIELLNKHPEWKKINAHIKQKEV